MAASKILTQPSSVLGVTNHSRQSAGMRYVYPVISRRAGGVSIGINLNPNNACNWRCIYCQVPDLTRGGPPPLDLALLRSELDQLLNDVLQGDFMQTRVPDSCRVLKDVAFSGNGEPTSAPEFAEAVELVIAVMASHGLQDLPLRLITNGSLMLHSRVQRGVEQLGKGAGQVWFKVDAVSREGMAKINSTRTAIDLVSRRLRASAAHCDTWLQSCFFTLDGMPPTAQDMAAYREFVAAHVDILGGVHLYGLARPSLQEEAPRLGRLPVEWFTDLAEQLRPLKEKGLTVEVSP